MNRILQSLFTILLVFPLAYAQKNQIKEAQKELKAGNLEQALAILAPVEYLIRNADAEDRVNFYYAQGTALLKQANNHNGASKNISKAILVFSDLIQVESESKNEKFSSEAIKYLQQIKENLVLSANADMANADFEASSSKLYQAYLIDTKDTLQLYNAALTYKNTDDLDTALKLFEELKTIKYSGNTLVYVAYSKKLLRDEDFITLAERDAKIKSGTHMRPGEKILSKKGQIYKNIALIYAKKGYKEKALKTIDITKQYNGFDESLALIEADLYLDTKDYETFDRLATSILDVNYKNAELAFNFGMKCEQEQYFEGAQFYYKKAIEMDPQFANSYIHLSTLLINKSNSIDSKIKELGISETNKIAVAQLKLQKEQILKSAPAYLQKAIIIDPFNTNAKELMANINMATNVKSKAFVSGD
jgi:tetratricopeptide (TPR) repeat protein